MHHRSVVRPGALCSALFLSLVALAACRAPEAATPALRTGASVTVYPVLMAGRPVAEAAWTVGLLLEQAGCPRVEVAEQAFDPGAAADPAAQATAFAQFVARQAPGTDYALLGCYLGTPRSGVSEVRTVLADGSGAVVWRDRQGATDAPFRRASPSDPMAASVFLVRRVGGPLRLQDPLRAGAPKGALAERFRARTGVPDKSEFDAMQQRQTTFRGAAPGAKVLVYPPRVGATFAVDAGRQLVDAINRRGLVRAVLAEAPLRFTARQSVNQLQVLWSAARSFQSGLRKGAVDADYVLTADYLVAGTGRPARGVHLFVLDRKGEFVIVDLQNSHHPDFQKVAPKSAADCTEVAVARLASHLD